MHACIHLLRQPPASAKGWTRWWWYGCAVTREEILRELQQMQAAGLGGVELQILYPLAADDRAQGIYNIPYFSPEFFDILQYTAKTARSLGLGLDITLGSSWPYGGPFLPKDMAAQPAVLLQIDVSGPQKNFCYDFTTRICGQIVCLSVGRMEHSRMVADSVRDITDLLVDKDLFGWPWGKVLQGLELPEGEWKITAAVVGAYRQPVSIPTRGAEGFVMDHCRSDVTDFFLQQAAQPILDALEPEDIRCFFCDSIELSGNNWTQNLLQEFSVRRGYRLEPYLYALWGEVGELTGRIRYDYYQTMSELTNENFFDRLTQWCHAHSVRSRIQAHGIWADILQTYACADIPEGESFGAQDKLSVNTIHRRLASSAAHLYGKPIVCNESFTWLRTPRFLVTLEQLKAAADAIFLDGMNAIVNHGYAYSPDEAGTPGWAFYASSHLNHTNPLWPCYPAFGAYIQRVSALLRQGYACNDVAIYLPQADIWADNPLCDLHMAMKLQEWFGWDVPDRISRAGYSFDYINDDVLQTRSTIDNGLRVGENTYHVLLLIGCTRLPVQTAERLVEFVKGGGILLATEQAPSRSCGLQDYRQNDARVRACMDELFCGECGVWSPCGRGFAAVAPNRREGLIHLLGEKRRPDAALSCPEQVGYQHRRLRTGDVYFLANLSDQPVSLDAQFSAHAAGVCVYSAVTAEPMPARVSPCGESTAVSMALAPFDSAFVFFSDTLRTPDFVPAASPTCLPLTEPWQLDIPAVRFTQTQPQPEFWEQYDPVRLYSGFGTYETQFTLCAPPPDRAELQFTQVATSARVYLNDTLCGVLWKRPWRVDVTKWLRPGINTLRVVCGNQLFNCALDPKNEPPMYAGTLLREWPYFTQTINQIRQRRISLKKERESGLPPQPSGLQGPVCLLLWP